MSWISKQLINTKACLIAAILLSQNLYALTLIDKPPLKISQITSVVANNNQCELTLGWGSWPPYQFAEHGEQPKGLQIDLVEQIAGLANCRLNYVQQSFSENIQGIKDGSIDLTLDTTITSKRQEYALFSEPYRQEVLVLYIKPKHLDQCKGKEFSDIVKSGLRIGLNRGNIYGQSVSAVQNNPELNKKLIYSDTNIGLFEQLKSNELDGFFEDPTVLSYNLRKNGLAGALQSCKTTVYSGTVSFMFSKKTVSKNLVSRFNRALRKIKQTESYLMNWAW